MIAARAAVFFLGVFILASPSLGQSRLVRLEAGRLSVELKDAMFGKVITEIALKAGFEVDMQSDIFARTLSIKFRDLDLREGIKRLLALISQNNYFIHYGPGGRIKKLEVFSTTPPEGRGDSAFSEPDGPGPSGTARGETHPDQKPLPDVFEPLGGESFVKPRIAPSGEPFTAIPAIPEK